MPRGWRSRTASGALALVLIGSFSAASQSQPVQIFQLALQLVTTIAAAVDGNDTVRWKKDTTAKLDTLISLSPKIIDDLKQLRIDVSKTVTTSFSEFTENTLKADVKQFEINLAELKEYQQQNEDSRTRIN
jgi:cell shape-determining protein MreC